MSTLAAAPLPMLLEEVEVRSVERLSPSFVRLELGSPALADLGVDSGRLYDQRIKLVLPHGDRPLPSFAGADEAFLRAWWERPAEERGHVRTYTVRQLRGSGAETRLVVDVVVHDAGPGHEVGPGCAWASRARVGDRVVTMAPRRGVPYGGIEFAPGDATRLLLVGDETAVPAVSAILEQLDADAQGAVFLEVPQAGDVLDLRHPAGVEVTWLPRRRAEGAGPGLPGGRRGQGRRGERLHPAVLAHLGATYASVEVDDDEIDPDLWETPTYSSSGEEVATAAAQPALTDLYAWIAGEAKVVTGLRRALVRDLGLDRRRVAFMGYWREGVAMRS